MSGLCLPAKILDQHLVVLGKTGAGKSSALRHIVEHLLHQNKRVCIIDPKGDWWGLKASADGRGAGFPVITFGDFKNPEASDVPINSQSGQHIAELITSGNRPCVIGFRGWMMSHMVQFWIDFAGGIFNANSGELYLVGDEFHNFAPKGKIMDPQAGKCLHWSNRLLSEGRGLGIVCLLASQRPQKVHNDTLTSCETLVAMRVVHAADRGAVEDWIDGCGDKDQGRVVLKELAGMPRGEAFVWSPEVGFGPKRVKFPMFKTFDSFAPPQLQRKVVTSGWSGVDLDAVKSKLATVIEESRANDPRELRKRIAELEKQARVQKPVQHVEQKIKEVPTLTKQERKTLDRYAAAHEKLLAVAQSVPREVIVGILGKIGRQIVAAEQKPARIHHDPRPIPAARRTEPMRSNGSSGAIGTVGLTAGELKVMCAIAQYPNGASRATLKVLTGYRSTSLFEFSRSLIAKGCAEKKGDLIVPTQDGIDALGSSYEPLPTGSALREHWENKLTGGERKIFDILVGCYPDSLNKQDIMDQSGYKGTSSFEFTRQLKARQLAEDSGRGLVRAAAILFD